MASKGRNISERQNMLEPRKLHLFNCDRTYKLDAVQDLLNARTANNRFVNSEKHYFSLAEMSDMSTKIIPKLEMDMAFFVVHAHESRLSINEDNAGIGYAKIYRALQKAAGENVIIVIGGDDNYTNEDEENQFVISRWAKRKISSQFREEFLDGRKGFIFSWNKKHRKIHEEALLHFFDSSKKGQKFEHQPTQRKLPAKLITPPPVRSAKLAQPFDLHSSLPESSSRCWREEFFASSGTEIQTGKSNVPSVSVLRGERRRDTSQLDTVRKTKPRKLHLFNCDRTYKLDAVQDLLNATTAKSRFVNLEKHYFSLAEMSDMSTNIIPKLEMDMAFFVVHAHESPLSINEDKAGIGYAKIYRALQKVAGENVIIVIGGDDNYTNEDEENQFVISRWAKRKISSQFREEFLDGRKGFIFSWNKKHRKIHEEALLHFFDSSKKGQKFEHQPTQRKLPAKPITPPPVRSAKLAQPFDLHSSLPEGSLECWREQSFASSSTEIQARKSNVPSVSVRGEIRGHISQPDTVCKTKPKDLAILGCDVSDESRKTVTRIFNDLRAELDISTDTAVEKCSPASAKSYLLNNTLRFCVLVVDGKTVKDVYERSKLGRDEYEDLIRTAANKVVEKVVVVICDPFSVLLPRDETFISDAVGRIFGGTSKGLVVSVKYNKMNMEPDVLAQLILASASSPGSIKLQTSYRGDFPRSSFTSPSPVSAGTERQGQLRKDHSARHQEKTSYGSNRNERNIRQQKFFPAVPAAPPHTTKKHTGESVKLKTHLRYGRISYNPRDVEILDPGFEVPSHIKNNLFQNYFQTPEAVVKVVSDPKSGDLRWSVDPKSKGFFGEKKQESYSSTSTESDDPVPKASNETFVLIARVRYGEVSMKKGDLELIYPEWETPKYLAETLRREYRITPNGKLFVISDEKGDLRCVVKVGKMVKALTLFNKTFGRSPTN